jgi:hypothetical protein
MSLLVLGFGAVHVAGPSACSPSTDPTVRPARINDFSRGQRQ